MSANIQTAADKIFEAARSKVSCEPVRDLLLAGDIRAAYAVQDINTDRWLAAGRKIIGRKIGLTSKAVQTQLGVDQPDFGILYDDMLVKNGGSVSMQKLMQPKAEAEIAFVLKSGLTKSSHSESDIIAATDYILPAIEIVGSRITNWNIRITDTIADNASSGMFVLGTSKRSLKETDIINCKMAMTKGGQVVSSGIGSACLGSPIQAAIWLADTMQKVGRPLAAGDVVMTGALGPMVAAVAGDSFEAQIDGLGTVKVAFEA